MCVCVCVCVSLSRSLSHTYLYLVIQQSCATDNLICAHQQNFIVNSGLVGTPKRCTEISNRYYSLSELFPYMSRIKTVKLTSASSRVVMFVLSQSTRYAYVYYVKLAESAEVHACVCARALVQCAAARQHHAKVIPKLYAFITIL